MDANIASFLGTTVQWNTLIDDPIFHFQLDEISAGASLLVSGTKYTQLITGNIPFVCTLSLGTGSIWQQTEFPSDSRIENISGKDLVLTSKSGDLTVYKLNVLGGVNYSHTFDGFLNGAT